jgi:predicted nucleotidyltransferase
MKIGSDVDILVSFERGTTLFTLASLTNYLQDKLGIKVDVVSERALKPKLKLFCGKGSRENLRNQKLYAVFCASK